MFDFGARLQGLRRERGWTQAQVADRLQVSALTVSRWEQNYIFPSTERLIELSSLYNLPLNYLIGLDKEKTVVVDKLTPSQQKIIADLTEEFRCDQQEKGTENGLSRRQLNIINTLFSEFGNRKA